MNVNRNALEYIRKSTYVQGDLKDDVIKAVEKAIESGQAPEEIYNFHLRPKEKAVLLRWYIEGDGMKEVVIPIETTNEIIEAPWAPWCESDDFNSLWTSYVYKETFHEYVTNWLKKWQSEQNK